MQRDEIFSKYSTLCSSAQTSRQEVLVSAKKRIWEKSRYECSYTLYIDTIVKAMEDAVSTASNKY